MGSRMKKSIFDEQTSKALKKWHMAVKKKHAKGEKSPTRTLGGSTSSKMGSPLRTSNNPSLHRFRSLGLPTRAYPLEDGESDPENDPSTPMTASNNSAVIQVDHEGEELELHVPHNGVETKNEDNFSFSKPEPQR
nr:MLO-like protein 8 [Ipomoea batatas]